MTIWEGCNTFQHTCSELRKMYQSIYISLQVVNLQLLAFVQHVPTTGTTVVTLKLQSLGIRQSQYQTNTLLIYSLTNYSYSYLRRNSGYGNFCKVMYGHKVRTNSSQFQSLSYSRNEVWTTNMKLTHPWSTWPLYTCRCRRWSPSWGLGWVWRACRRHTASDHWRPETAGIGSWPSACAGSAPEPWWSGCFLWSSGGRWAHTARSGPSGSCLTSKKERKVLFDKI